ncbi:hypothetical protein [Paenibacillus montanisoli]|uniref:PsbP C-terminal domain-containing protein n=1 Tax=Paenibacillus montanisoli TaxID=2081970 RepID=A0A328TYS8_9BACL|nr:hypothetical protein [Paenibacillus montanisoli]RAP75639.1 hypothetical protein DL346_09260 [Paenibacillus montanisoli]
MKKLAWLVAAVILLAALSACTSDPDGSMETTTGTTPSESAATNSSVTNGDPQTDETAGTPDPWKNLPATKTDTIELEGMKESFEFTLHESAALGFSTYIANDLLAEEASSGEGDAMLVYANFAGQKNEDAKVHIFTGTITTIEEQKAFAEQVVKNSGFEIRERTEPSRNRFEWSESEFDIAGKSGSGETILGTVSIFQHGGRVYHAIVQYPVEYEEGFIPRIVKMFEDIVWHQA